MEVGTAETLAEAAETVRRRGSRIASSSPGGSGNGGGGGGPEGDGPNGPNPKAPTPDPPQVDKSRYIAYFLLIAVGMTFAGLLGAYLMIATNRAAEWKPFDLPFQIWVSTLIILLSSVSYSLGKAATDRGDYRKGRDWLVATTALGGVFLASQLILWLELVQRGYYMRGNPYAGFFYILTAAHLIHVAGGMVALGSLLLTSWEPPRSDVAVTRRRDLARSVGWYWHFMGFLWVVLFLMLGFWK